MVNKEENRRFLDIYEKEADNLFRFIYTRISNREEAIDLSSEVFQKLFEVMSEEQVGNPRAYMFKIARNKIIDWYRKSKSESLDQMTQNDEDSDIMPYQIVDEGADESIFIKAEGNLILKALSKLSAGFKDTLYLRFIEDLEPREIAEILEISPNAVSIRINRGLEEMRKILNIKNE